MERWMKRYRTYNMERFVSLVLLTGLHGWVGTATTYVVLYNKESERDKKMIRRLDELCFVPESDQYYDEGE